MLATPHDLSISKGAPHLVESWGGNFYSTRGYWVRQQLLSGKTVSFQKLAQKKVQALERNNVFV